jgi:hypothetical protein
VAPNGDGVPTLWTRLLGDRQPHNGAVPVTHAAEVDNPTLVGNVEPLPELDGIVCIGF